MLPNITLQLEFEVPEQPAITSVHKTFDWDFDAGDFKLVDGRPVEVTGLDYVKIWTRKALLTVKDRFPIYAGTDYGSSHHDLIGLTVNWDFVKSEYERTIREALLLNDAITYAENFAFTQEGSKLTISFDLGSIYGSLAQEVLL